MVLTYATKVKTALNYQRKEGQQSFYFFHNVCIGGFGEIASSKFFLCL
jgi:hypothetical protein